jgi:fermentation-respiration switch protein FrsA (DUF1100 family)
MQRSDVTFQSGDTSCTAWLYRPEGQGDVPCVVLAHGFGAVRELRLDAYAERFAAAGLAALVFDYRHFGASGGNPRQLIDVRKQHEDWRAAIAYARRLDGIDPQRIALWGTSFSGGQVVALAADDAGIAAVVSQVPFTDGLSAARALGLRQSLRLTAAALRDEYRERRGRSPFYIPTVGPPGALAALTAPGAVEGVEAMTPPGFKQDLRSTPRVGLRPYNPYRKLGRVRCPVLVCVAEKDSTTIPGPAISAAERTPNAQLMRYPVGHFEVYVGKPFERAVSDQTRFLTRHLLGTQGRPAASLGAHGR